MICSNGVCVVPKFFIKTEKPVCKNYLICSNKSDQEYLDAHENYCIDCNNLFGKWREKSFTLKFTETLETCPLCFQKNQKCIKRVDCDHFLCVDCFRLVYYGYHKIEKPHFPIDGREKEYLDNISNNITEDWMKDKIIENYINKLDLWTDYNMKIWNIQNKHNLLLCFECNL